VFDVGFWEIAIIAVIALIILGPERLPRAARTAGLWVGKARRTLAEVKRDIDRELDASDLKDLKNIKEEFKDTKTVLEDAAKTVNESVVDEQDFSIMPDSDKKTETAAVKPKTESKGEQQPEAADNKAAT